MAGTENLSNDQLIASFVIKDYVIKNYPEVKVDDYDAIYLWNNVLSAEDQAIIKAKTDVIFKTEDAK